MNQPDHKPHLSLLVLGVAVLISCSMDSQGERPNRPIDGCFGIYLGENRQPILHCQCGEAGVGREVNTPTYFPEAHISVMKDSIILTNAGKRIIRESYTKGNIEYYNLLIHKGQSFTAYKIDQDNCACKYDFSNSVQSSIIDSCFYKLRQSVYSARN